MERGFDRKVFSPRVFRKDLGYLIRNARGIRAAMRDPALGHAFMEKTMMVVTAINGCSYCRWFHAAQGSSVGMTEDEIRDMFNLQFQTNASAHELPALAFAQHYAETDRHPDPQMEADLDAFYGAKTAYHIRLFIRMIFFGNLFGNTFDAFLSRLRGQPAPQSSAPFEALLFLISWPVLLPAKWRMDRQARRDGGATR